MSNTEATPRWGGGRGVKIADLNPNLIFAECTVQGKKVWFYFFLNCWGGGGGEILVGPISPSQAVNRKKTLFISGWPDNSIDL